MKNNRKNAVPPAAAEKLLQYFLDDEIRYSALGDFAEIYNRLSEKNGKTYALLWYLWQIVRSVPPFVKDTMYWRTAMFRNYLKTSFRNMKANKGFSFINISGLTIGLAGCLLILMYVISETGYENMHVNRDSICRVATEWGTEERASLNAGAMAALGPAVKEGLPEIENAVRFYWSRDAELKAGEKEFEEGMFFFADNGVLDMFTIPLVAGGKQSALADPYTVIISQKTARKYFGAEDPLGKTLLYDDNPLTVTGVFKDLPANTHLRCDLIGSMSTLESLKLMPKMPWNNWGNYYTYIMVRPGTDIEQLNKKMHDILTANTGEWFSKRMHFVVQKLTDIHMRGDLRGDIGRKGNRIYVYLFLSVAVLVLLIACLNFMNLSTARSLKRIKEIGMRKVLGAYRGQIVGQFLGESLFITIISIAAGLVLFFMLNPYLASFLGIEMVYDGNYIRSFIILVPLLILVVGIIAGSYPAFYLSRYRPVESLGSRLRGGTGRSVFRIVLVVVQFTILIGLITATTVVFKQLSFVKNSDLGFDKENVVLVRFPGADDQFVKSYDALKTEILKLPSVEYAAGTYTVQGVNNRASMTISKADSSNGSARLLGMFCDSEFEEALKLEIVKGRGFSGEYGSSEQEKALINESAVREVGLTEPIGAVVTVPIFTGGQDLKNEQVEVVGVVKDFHFESLHKKIKPMIFLHKPALYKLMAIRIAPKNTAATVESIRKICNTILPGIGTSFSFLSDKYDSLYLSEDKISQLFTVFTLLAVFIAAIGLLGLTSFITELRTKEIGIRKVMGASVKGLAVQLTKDFTKWVLVSNLFAWPAAGYFMNKWLQNFAYSTKITFDLYLISGLVGIIIAVSTVSFLTVKAALSNPVDSLRNE